MGVRSVLGKLADLVARHAPSNAVRVACQRFKGVRVGEHVYIAYDVHIDEAWPGLVEIEDHARVGIGVIVLAHSRPGEAWMGSLGEERAAVRIRRHAALYAGAVVMPGVTVGECAIVRAGAVVEEDVPPFTVVAGVPARVVAALPRDRASLDGPATSGSAQTVDIGASRVDGRTAEKAPHSHSGVGSVNRLTSHTNEGSRG
jgi:acetyltransferase-like isoleucine patch superfamily enzyme